MLSIYKKILVFLLVFIGFSGVDAALAGNQFIYLGVAPVYSSTQFNWKNVDTGQTIIDQTSTNTQIGLFTGYGVLVDKIYFGVEGATQFGERKATSQTHAIDTQAPLSNTATMDGIYIVDFRPGYVFGDKNSMIYGVLGLNTSNFSIHQEDSSGATLDDSGSMRHNGLRLGLGYNLGLGKHFMARVEYVFTKFSSFQFTDTLWDGSQTTTWELNPYSNEVSLGLSVVFNV